MCVAKSEDAGCVRDACRDASTAFARIQTVPYRTDQLRSALGPGVAQGDLRPGPQIVKSRGADDERQATRLPSPRVPRPPSGEPRAGQGVRRARQRLPARRPVERTRTAARETRAGGGVVIRGGVRSHVRRDSAKGSMPPIYCTRLQSRSQRRDFRRRPPRTSGLARSWTARPIGRSDPQSCVVVYARA